MSKKESEEIKRFRQVMGGKSIEYELKTLTGSIKRLENLDPKNLQKFKKELVSILKEMHMLYDSLYTLIKTMTEKAKEV